MPSPIPPPEAVVIRRGVGFLPPGGLPGQVLEKADADDFATTWASPPASASVSLQDGYLIVTDGTTTKKARALDL